MDDIEKIHADDKTYESMVEEAPEREVDTLDDDGRKSLEQSEAENPNLTDLQTALRKLFPPLGTAIDQALMFGRIAPDMFIPLLRIMVNAEIKRLPRDKAINLSEIASKFYTLGSIGLDGKGRADTIELAGRASESDELEQLSKSMGGAF